MGRCRPFLPRFHRRVPGTKTLVADEMARADGQELLRLDRAGHDRDGDQRPDHRRRHAPLVVQGLPTGLPAAATGLATPRAQALVAGWKAALRHLRRGLGWR